MEVYLQRTIDDILEKAHGEIEIIVTLDGYWPKPALKEDKRLTIVHFVEPIGQRQAVNRMAEIARGDYLMKLDAHCCLSLGFDVILTKNVNDNWTVVPRRYDLDTEKWDKKDHTKCDYMYLTALDAEGGPLRAKKRKGKETSPTPLIDSVMACQGSCFVMTRDRFFELGGLDEAHGSFGWLGCEIACKSWLSGGKLKVNKAAWYAHWQKGTKGHRFPIKREDIDFARDYAVDLWTNNRWPKQVKKFSWLMKKFR